MHLKPQRTLRVNVAKRKTYLNSLFFLYVFKFGKGSLAKSFSLKRAQRLESTLRIICLKQKIKCSFASSIGNSHLAK
jgi:hypothetical protein